MMARDPLRNPAKVAERAQESVGGDSLTRKECCTRLSPALLRSLLYCHALLPAGPSDPLEPVDVLRTVP